MMYHASLRSWLDRARMRWITFSYNFGWSAYVGFLDGWIAKCAMGIPIIGYLIIFNDTVSQHVSFDILAGENSRPAGGLSSTARLKLLYFGLILLGIANIVYLRRRPSVFRVGTNEFDYVERALQHFTASKYIDIHGTIRHEGHHTLHGKYYDAEYDSFLELALGKHTGSRGRDAATTNWDEAKKRYEEFLRSMLIENFYRNNVKRSASLAVAVGLAATGYFLLFIPSLDLFIKVLRVTLS